MDYFRPEGDEMGANLNAYYPRPIIGSKQNQQVQSRYLQNAAYIRLKNIQIGYTLPKAWIQKLTWRKYDYSSPEIIYGLVPRWVKILIQN